MLHLTFQNVGKEWFRQIYAFTRVSSQPNMLVGFIAGDAAITLEQISDEEVIDVCTAIFQRFTGDSEIPRPKCVRRFVCHSITAIHTALGCIND